MGRKIEVSSEKLYEQHRFIGTRAGNGPKPVLDNEVYFGKSVKEVQDKILEDYDISDLADDKWVILEIKPAILKFHAKIETKITLMA